MRTLSVSISIILISSSARAGIDLTPVTQETTANGVKLQQLNFRDDKQRIEYEPPQGWTFDGNATQLRLKPAANLSEATITVVPANKPQPFDENAIKLLEQQFLNSLPVGSQLVKIEDETPNPVLLNGRESFEITASYQSMGEKFMRSVVFVNLSNAQLVFRLTARKAEFPSLHRDFKTSLFSWHWVEQSDSTE